MQRPLYLLSILIWEPFLRLRNLTCRPVSLSRRARRRIFSETGGRRSTRKLPLFESLDANNLPRYEAAWTKMGQAGEWRNVSYEVEAVETITELIHLHIGNYECESRYHGVERAMDISDFNNAVMLPGNVVRVKQHALRGAEDCPSIATNG